MALTLPGLALRQKLNLACLTFYRDNLDFTRRPISFDPLRMHLALIERRPPFAYLRARIINIDLLPDANDGKWVPTVEWRETVMGSQSTLIKGEIESDDKK
jgi:hypothetical protein